MFSHSFGGWEIKALASWVFGEGHSLFQDGAFLRHPLERRSTVSLHGGRDGRARETEGREG